MSFSLLNLRSGWRSAEVAGYRGPLSDHFNGKHFQNLSPLHPKSLWSVLKWRLGAARAIWPKSHPDNSPAIPLTQSQELRWTFINHATWLLQLAGLNILTDPVWSENVGPVSWLGPRRVRAPGVAFERLPRIDVVLISHNHYDHLDVPTLERLEQRDHPLFIAGLGNAAFLKKLGLKKVQELDWWQSVQEGPVGIHFVPSRHWSRRGWSDINQTLWGGFVIAGAGRAIYFAGDTGYDTHFRLIAQRFTALDVALLPIGAYEPRWFMKDTHLNPAEAVQAHRELGVERSFGMHFGTFQLSDEGFDQPGRDLAQALAEQQIPRAQFVVPGFGQSFTLAAVATAARASA